MPAYALTPGECVVWWARPDDADPALLSLLTPTEQARMTQLLQPVDRSRYLVARGVERLAMAAYLHIEPAKVIIERTCPTCGKPHGRPRLNRDMRSTIELNVTHAGTRIAVAFALGAPLGIDVEPVNATLDTAELARVALTPDEARLLAQSVASTRPRDFLIYWTRKEAIVKATGCGLALSPRSFAVSGPDEPPRIVATERPDLMDGLTLHDLRPDAEHVACLAIAGACRRISAADGSALIRAWSQRTA